MVQGERFRTCVFFDPLSLSLAFGGIWPTQTVAKFLRVGPTAVNPSRNWLNYVSRAKVINYGAENFNQYTKRCNGTLVTNFSPI